MSAEVDKLPQWNSLFSRSTGGGRKGAGRRKTDGVGAERRETEVFTLQHVLFDMLAKQAEQNAGSDSCHSRVMRPENDRTNFKYI